MHKRCLHCGLWLGNGVYYCEWRGLYCCMTAVCQRALNQAENAMEVGC